MRVVQYCQHVLGIGHYFRSLEIARALWRHEVVLVTGGPPVDAELPPHVSEFRLPGLRMDSVFAEVFPTDGNRSLSEVQEERAALLYSLFENANPDLFVVELYPFGRKRFDFELLPVLKAVGRHDFGPLRVVCSLRDILVEKENQEAYERRVLDLLNLYFDALLVHSDPTLISLEETFERTAEIRIPVVHTGFIAPRPDADAARRLRKSLQLEEDDLLVVASAGGGQVGTRLLRAVLEAHSQLARPNDLRLFIFAGPFMAETDYASLAGRAVSIAGVQVARFTREFLSFLAAADLSISMAGYNTCMNILATGVSALVWPFDQNREQRLRAEKLAALGAVRLLSDEDLRASRLGALMEEGLSKSKLEVAPVVRLDGAQETAKWLEAWWRQEKGAVP